MKMHCQSCGCHFDNDFEETLEPDCTLWQQKGLDALSTEHKRAVWNTYFSLPVDDIADHTGTIVQIEIRGMAGRTYSCNEFEQYVPGYAYMDDDARRKFQKRLFKFVYNQPTDERLRMQLVEMGEWYDLIAFEEQARAKGIKPTVDVVCMSEQRRTRVRSGQES